MAAILRIGEAPWLLLSVVLLLSVSTTGIVTMYAHASTVSLPPPHITVELPSSVTVGETFMLNYTYAWAEKDVYAPLRYWQPFVLPDEFSVLTPNVTASNYLVKQYEHELLKKYWVLLEIASTKIRHDHLLLRLDRELSYDEDYLVLPMGWGSPSRYIPATMGGIPRIYPEDNRKTPGYFVVRDDHDDCMARFVVENDLGRVFPLWDLPNDLYDGIPRQIAGKYVPDLRPVYKESVCNDPACRRIGDPYFFEMIPDSFAQATLDGTRYLPRDEGGGWIYFAKFLHEVRSRPDAPHDMRQWLLANGLMWEFVDDFLEKYPEFLEVGGGSGGTITKSTCAFDNPKISNGTITKDVSYDLEMTVVEKDPEPRCSSDMIQFKRKNGGGTVCVYPVTADLLTVRGL